MKLGLRFGGIGMIAVGVVLTAIHFAGGPKPPVGDFTKKMSYKEKVITGAYKTYGVKDAILPMWLAKTVFHNGTNARVTDLRVRYRVSEYSDWCSWHNYAAVAPDQTVVDLYYPIFSSACAKLTSRAPAELLMETEYVDCMGKKHQSTETRPVSMLDRHEFIFSDLTSEERTLDFWDQATYSPLLAAWVSRDDDVVARLASIANKKAGGVGAGTNDEDCIKAMKALYDIMRAIHVSYQHPASLVDRSLSYDIKLVQSLQYPRDTIQKRSGTCIDLAILYAAMLNSISITPYLVVLDGHCFPMAKTPSGTLLGVEVTGVQDGYSKSADFVTVVKYAMKEWEELKSSGRYVLVDLSAAWAGGIANPELAPLPPDILEAWGIMSLVNAPSSVATAPAAPRQATSQPAAPQPSAPQPSVALDGPWRYDVKWVDGTVVNGQCIIKRKDGTYLMIVTGSYVLRENDGRQHQYYERDDFVGTLKGQSLTAQCNSAAILRDGQGSAPQGLPLQLNLRLGPDGRTMEGQLTNKNGARVAVYMQKS
ncbi:MAG: transglutaminase-like domain-containing protein [Syntrophobacteraceae bacterium]|jgi:hypothetical protein